MIPAGELPIHQKVRPSSRFSDVVATPTRRGIRRVLLRRLQLPPHRDHIQNSESIVIVSACNVPPINKSLSALLEVPQHRDVAAAQHHHGPGGAGQPVLPQPADPDGPDRLLERGAPPDARLQRRLLHLRRRRHVRQQPQDEHLPAARAPLLRHRLLRHQVGAVEFYCIHDFGATVPPAEARNHHDGLLKVAKS